jgi:hypothetical protein
MARLGSDIATFPTGGFFHGGTSIGLGFSSLYVLIRNVRPTREPTSRSPSELGEYEAPLSNKKAREVLGFREAHNWRKYVKAE